MSNHASEALRLAKLGNVSDVALLAKAERLVGAVLGRPRGVDGVEPVTIVAGFIREMEVDAAARADRAADAAIAAAREAWVAQATSAVRAAVIPKATP